MDKANNKQQFRTTYQGRVAIGYTTKLIATQADAENATITVKFYENRGRALIATRTIKNLFVAQDAGDEFTLTGKVPEETK